MSGASLPGRIPENEVFTSHVRYFNQGKEAMVEMSGITREVSVQDIVSFAQGRGIPLEKVSVAAACNCDPGYGGFADRHIELSWTVT